MASTSTLQTAIERLLPGEVGTLKEFVRTERAGGSAWRVVSRRIYELTGVDVAHETLRTWFPDEPAEAAS